MGEAGIKEVASYLLDHDHFTKVPLTVLVKITHSIFNVNKAMSKGNFQNDIPTISKIASFHQFVSHDFDASDHGTSTNSIIEGMAMKNIVIEGQERRREPCYYIQNNDPFR